MKKISLIVIILLLAFSAFATEIPAPFGKAKQLAMKAQPDLVGRYLLTFEMGEDSTYVFYVIGYLSQLKVIGIGKKIKNSLVVSEYSEEEDKFTLYTNGMRQEINKEQAIKFAFQIFRELVERKLI